MLIVWIHKSWVRRLDWFLWQGGIKKVRTYAAIVETSQEEASIVPTFRYSIFNDNFETFSMLQPFRFQCCFGKGNAEVPGMGGRMSEIIFIVFLSPISHINGDIAGAGIFVVDQRKSDLQNSLFMILNHGQGSNIDSGKYFKMCHIAHIEIIKVQVLWILTDKEYQNYANRKFQIAKYIYSDFELVRI